MTLKVEDKLQDTRSDGRSDRFPWWVVVVPLVIALVVFVYQALTPDRLSRYQTHLPFAITDNSANPPHILTLMVIYPEVLALEEVPKMGRPIQVWLSDPQPSNPPLTYTVILEPLADGLLFTDRYGTPVVPSVKLSATEVPVESGGWFLYRTPGVASQPASVELKPRVLAPAGNTLDISPSTISIRLETYSQAFWRHFLDLVLGPATPLLGLAITLIGWFWNERKTQRERKQRQREQEEQRRREQEEQRQREQEEQRQREHQERQREREIAGLELLWATNRTAAVRRYLDLRKEECANAESETKRTLDRMWEQGWRVRVEQEAIASLARGDYALTHELTEVLYKEIAGNKSGAADEASPRPDEREDKRAATGRQISACAILTLLPGPSPSPEEKICALIALAASRGQLLAESLVSTLAQTFVGAISETGALPKAVEELNKRLPALWLVATPSVQKHCQDWINAEKPDLNAAESLRNLAFRQIMWPSLWPSPHGAKEPAQGIAEALERLGWQENQNPFGPDRVEDDTRVPDKLWVAPPMWEALKVPGPTVLLSERGCGQTTALGYLLQHHREQWRNILDRPATAGPLLFTVLMGHEMFLRARTREECLGELVFGMGQALLHFLAFNPFLLDRSAAHPHAQQAISRLCEACQHRLGDLEGYLRRYLAEHEEPHSLVPLWLPELLRSAAAGTQPVALNAPAEVLFALKEARLAESQGFVVAVDIPARLLDRPEAASLTDHLRPLVELMPDLALCGVDLKLGLPVAVAPVPGVTAGVRHLAQWPDAHLKELLTRRLEQAGGGLDSLMDPGEDSDLSKWIVEAAEGSPQRLVRLGNRLLAYFGRKKPEEKLTSQDLDDVLRQMEAELSTAT